jgi:hypothetical protein
MRHGKFPENPCNLKSCHLATEYEYQFFVQLSPIAIFLRHTMREIWQLFGVFIGSHVSLMFFCRSTIYTNLVEHVT